MGVGSYYLGSSCTVDNQVTFSVVNLKGNVSCSESGLEYTYFGAFNPSTTISFQLKQEGIVSLIIYDGLGREVQKLVEGFKEAGEYAINFNSQALKSGIYFYTLRINNYTETKQMLLVK